MTMTGNTEANTCLEENECKTVAQATREGRLEEVKRLVEEGHPVDAADNRGWRPIHDAAERNFIDCLKFLLEQEATCVDWQSFEGYSPLYLASQNGHVKAIEVLIEHKADPNLKDHLQMAPLFVALKHEHFACVEYLLEHGADLNCGQYVGVTPLHHAAAVGKRKFVEVLLKNGADLDVREEFNITPIFTAAQYGSEQALKLMLEAADERKQQHLVNVCAEDGASPLFLAAQEGHYGCVQLLLNHGADANLTTKDPVALPLHAAMQFTRTDCIDALLSPTDQQLLTKCDVNLWDLATREKEGLVIKQLIDAGLNINVRLPLKPSDAFSPQVLSYFNSIKFSSRISAIAAVAHFKNPMACAEIVLRAGANPNAKTAYDIPALLPAINNRNQGLTELLIAYGAVVNMYHPLVIGNMGIIVALPWWKGLNALLKCGAEVESLFSQQKQKDKMLINEDDLNDEEVTEPESSDNERNSNSSPAKKRKRKSKPTPFVQTLRAARYTMKNYDISIGQVLHRLIAFAGYVTLSPELEPLLDSAEEWKELMRITENPKPLKHCCRWKIRKLLGSLNLLKIDPINELNLPSSLKEYLMFEEIE